jgi:hypothetical protein
VSGLTSLPKREVDGLTQILEVDSEAQEGATHNEQNAKKSKCAVIKTSTRQVRIPANGYRYAFYGR